MTAAKFPAKFQHKNIRLPAERYLGRNLYFVTLCFANRRRFGASPRVATWLIARLRKHAAICQFLIHAYCVMPDHLHALAAGAADGSNLTKLVESFKQETAVEFARRTPSAPLAVQILRSHPAERRRYRARSLVHLDEPGTKKAVPRPGGMPVSGLLYGNRNADARGSSGAVVGPAVEARGGEYLPR
jgi:REP element-mobilizing transposase RayT